MSNLSNLRDALNTQAASITNEIDRLEVLATIEEWYALRVALADLNSKGMSSYSIGVRTVTRRDMPEMQHSERLLYGRIQEGLYCRGAGVVDNRTDDIA